MSNYNNFKRGDNFTVWYEVCIGDGKHREVQEDVFNTEEEAREFALSLHKAMGDRYLDLKRVSRPWVKEHLGVDGWIFKLYGIRQETVMVQDIWCGIRGNLKREFE